MTTLETIKATVYDQLIEAYGEIPSPAAQNQHEERLEARRERLEGRAADAAKRSDAAWEASHAATAGIPLGQPILVGHHSEKRHRRNLAKSDSAMRRCVDEQNKAGYYAEQAAAVGSGGIATNDPDATRKLLLKLMDLQITQEIKKAANKIIKSKNKKYPTQESKIAELLLLGLSEATANKLFEGDFCGRIGFPAYELSNNNATMKQVKERLQAIANLSQVEDKTYQLLDGFLEAEINKEEGRVFLRNKEKPIKAIREIYVEYGYRWSPTNEAWSRTLTAAAINSINSVQRAIAEILKEAQED